MAKITPVSHTRMELGNKCAYAFKEKYVKKNPKPAILTADILIRGQVFHSIVAEANQLCITKDEQTIMGNAVKIAPDHAHRLNDSDYADVLQLCEKWDSYHMIPNISDAKAEVKLAVDEAWQPCDYDNEKVAYLRGRLDLISIERETAHVIDYKTNWQAQSEAHVLQSYQLGIYAVLLMAHYPEVQVVNANMDFVRVPIRRERIITRDDLDGIKARIMADVKYLSGLKKYPAITNSWCSGCQFIGKCPAFVNIDVADTLVTSLKQAEKMAAETLGLEGLVKARKDALKAWINVHGDVKAGSDRVLGYQQSTGVSYDILTALKGLLKLKIEPEQLAELVGMPSTTVKKGVKKIDNEAVTKVVNEASIQTGGSTFKFYKPKAD